MKRHPPATLKIGEISEHTGISVRMIRYYEKLGLLKPRRENKYRTFVKEDVRAISRIKFYQNLGFSLKDIATFLKRPTKASGTQLRNLLIGQLDFCHQEIISLEKKKKETIKTAARYCI